MSKRIKEALTEFLKSRGIQPGRGVYDIPIHRQPYFKEYYSDHFTKSESFSNTHICLPLWRSIKTEDLEEIAQSIVQFDQKYK